MCEFLDERRDWLRVEKLDRGNGHWDVVLVIDGTYFIEDPKFEKKVLAMFERDVRRALRSQPRKY